MRLHLILPRAEPDVITPPSLCPYAGCGGQHFGVHQLVSKTVRDTQYAQMNSPR